jgi:hypothetical protein
MSTPQKIYLTHIFLYRRAMSSQPAILWEVIILAPSGSMWYQSDKRLAVKTQPTVGDSDTDIESQILADLADDAGILFNPIIFKSYES